MRKVLQKIEVHPFEKRTARLYRLAKKEMSTKNYELFEKYDMVMIGDTIATSTRQVQLGIIGRLTRQINKDWDLVTRDEINRLVYEIMKKYSPDGKENWTTWEYKKTLRIFMRWLKLGNRDLKQVGDPEITSGIKMKKVRNKLVREDLLTDEDVSKILSATINPRDRALLAIQAEAGTRPGEILSLRIKHVKIDQYGARMTVASITPDGKELVSGSWDNTIKIWDINTGEEITT